MRRASPWLSAGFACLVISSLVAVVAVVAVVAGRPSEPSPVAEAVFFAMALVCFSIGIAAWGASLSRPRRR